MTDRSLTLSLPDALAPIAPLLQVRRNPQARRLLLRTDPYRRQVTLTLPPGIGAARAQRFLLEHRDWLMDRVSRFPQRWTIADGALLLWRGAEHRIRLLPGEGRAITIADGEIRLHEGPALPESRLKRHLGGEAARILEPMLRAKAEAAGKPIARLRIGDPRSRWGACAHDGGISLSWRLAMAPEVVADYVCAHEAAHLVHHDHGAGFWALTARLSADLKTATAWLKQHGARLHACL